METIIIEILKTNGVNAVILVIGIVWLNGKINILREIVKELKVEKTQVESCNLKHVEVDRRLNFLDKEVHELSKYDGG